MSDAGSDGRAPKRRRVDNPEPGQPSTSSSGTVLSWRGGRDAPPLQLHLPGYTDFSPVVVSGHILSLRAYSIERAAKADFVPRAKLEAQVLRNLAASGIDECTKFIALEQSKHGLVLVAYDNGITLLPSSDFLAETRRRVAAGETVWDPPRLDQLYDIAIQLVRLLGRVHDQQIRHGGLRTAVTSLDPQGRVNIGDYHFAYSATEEPPKEAGMREDVLSYLAPEATGRQARHCDHRSDYYGVGAILFELLTGAPPFQDEDPLELIHQVLTRQAPFATDVVPSVPQALSKVVAKLLSKSSTARYQTVGGLIYDLERLAAGQTDVTIGLIDAESRFVISSRLYGRDEQVRNLSGALDRVRTTSRGELILVRGASGVGKSILVDSTLHDAIVACEGCLTRAKFDQYKSSAPLFAITTALSGLIRRIFSEPEATLGTWRTRLKAAIGNEGRVVASVWPLLELVLEPEWLETQPPITELPPDQATARLETLTKAIFQAFARPAKPLLVVLDDLQWANAYDMDFIVSLMADRDNLDVLMCCIYRDGEVGPDHPIVKSLLPRLNGSVDQTFDLMPIELSHTIDLVGDTLRRDVTVDATAPAQRVCEDDLRALAELVLKNSAGNPFFAHTILKALHSAGLLVYNFAELRWTWDVEAIRDAQLAPDVVELLVAQIHKLAFDTQETLRVAACLGSDSIDPVYLARALGRPIQVVKHALRDAKRAGLVHAGSLKSLRRTSVEVTEMPAQVTILPTPLVSELGLVDDLEILPEAAGSPSTDSDATFRFLHDRVQQAAYSLVPVDSRNKLHYAIGQRLCIGLTDTELAEQAFDLAAHLNAGIEDVSLTPSEREILAKINILAGQKALRVAAARSAVGYLSTARDLLGPASWTSTYDLASTCYVSLVDAEYASSNYAEALAYCEYALQHIQSDLERLRIYSRCVRCATGINDPAAAVRFGFEGLRRCAGIEMPTTEEEAEAYTAKLSSKVVITVKEVAELARLPNLQDPVIEEAHSIMAALLPPVYFSAIHLLRPMTYKSIELTRDHGLCQAGIANFVTQGLLLVEDDPRLALAFGKQALSLLHDDHPLSCAAYKIHASHIQIWNEPIRETFPTFLKAISHGLATHNAEYTAYGCSELVAYSLMSGENLRNLETNCRTYTTLLAKFGQDISSLYLAIVHQSVLNLLGEADDPLVLDGTAFRASSVEILESRPLVLHLFVHAFFSMTIAFFLGDMEKARSHIATGRKYIAGSVGILYEAIFRLYEAILLCDDWLQTTKEERQRVDACIARFEFLANYAPDNFTGSMLWLKAERARAMGDQRSAHVLYDEAIDDANNKRYLPRSAMMNERCATMLGRPKLAAGYLLEAERQWRSWGSVIRADALLAEHSHLFASAGPRRLGARHRHSSMNTYGSPPPVSTSRRGSLDVGSDLGWDPASMNFAQSGPLLPSLSPKPTHMQFDEPISISSEGNASMPVFTRPFGSHGKVNSLPLPHTSGQRSFEVQSLDSDFLDGSSTSISGVDRRSALGVELDMKTVLKASLVISEELNADRVVSKLMSLVLRSAGADICHLILERDGLLCGEATSQAASSTLAHHRYRQSIEEQPEQFPVSIINYVSRSRASVINDFNAELGPTQRDVYLEARQPKSILCLPLQNHSKLVGVLFLANHQATQAFTPDRLELISLISAQAASAFERARLVGDLEAANASLTTAKKTLEEQVAHRTLELRDKNASLHDEIHEKEMVQIELRRARDVAESATKQKSLFLANMSHEIRTPFNAIVSLSSLLLETPLNPTQADWAQTIRNSSSELLTVVDDILDHSKIENGSLELQEEPFSLRGCIDGAVELLAEKAAAKNLELAFVWHQHDEHVIGDKVRLRQCLVNVISNATKFTSAGHIIVRATTNELDELCKQGRPMLRVRISVEDTGIGISAEGIKKLFKLYSQVDGADTTSKFGGTGLGLSICRQLSQQMGGNTWAESTRGKGSTFFIEIVCPRADDHSPTTPLPTFAGKRCLIVDAQEATRHILQFTIERMGLETQSAGSWEEGFALGLAAHQAEKPFVICAVDAFLPDFGALSLLRKLAQRDVKIKTLILTRMGSPVPDELRKLSSDFIIKPIKQHTLVAAIQRVLLPGGDRPGPIAATKSKGLGDFPNVSEVSKLRLLCVDDNPVNVKVGLTILKRLGYHTVDTACDGIACLEACAKQAYDIILLDVQMPRMNGLDAARELCRRYPANERPIIIAMTANALAGDREKCEEAGMDAYVSKPISIVDLVAKLNKAAATLSARHTHSSPTESASGGIFLNPAIGKTDLQVYRARMAADSAQRRTSSAASTTLTTSASSTPP